MAYTINTNISSLQAQDYLRITTEFQSKTINRVTSGLRIISAGDDAAGLAIANSIRSDRAVLTQGVRNAYDGLSTLQTIDGGMNNISQLLDRARTLAAQSASGTFTGDRSVLNSEFASVVSEIDRQAQSIGLNTGGTFARSLGVFIGGGRGNDAAAQIANGSASVDLSASTVDGQSLGLSGMRAAGVSGTDISTSSSTKVQDIVADDTNEASLANAGFTEFVFRGAGFSDNNDIKVSVTLSGITDTSTLVAAINDAIETAGNGTTAAATAFKNANIRAVVVSDAQGDGTVKERLGFISSTSAFQVTAGDRMSNALMGNFSSGTTGKALGNNFVAYAASAASGTTFDTTGGGNIIFRIQGGGLASPVDILVEAGTGASDTIDVALASLASQVATNTALQEAGITVSGTTAGDTLVFSSTRGESLDVQVAGDVRNRFGMGTYRLASTSATSFDYASVTSAGFTGNAALTQTFEFSIAGGAKQAITVAAGTADTVTNAVTALNALFNANSVLQAAGMVATRSGTEIIVSSNNGSAFRMNTVNEAVAGTFGFGGAGVAETVAFNANAQNAILGSVTSGQATTDTTNDTLYFKVNGGSTVSIDIGTQANLAAIVGALNADATFATTNHMRAQAVNNQLMITNTNGDNFEIVDGTASMHSVAGFELGQQGLAEAATFNSGGAYNTALGTNNDVFRFSAIRYGSDEQTVNITVNDAQGVQHSLAVSLRNDAIGRNARSLDEVIATINNELQTSGDATLKQIVALKEQTYDGTQEGVRFISKLSGFRVTVGNVGSSTAATETGIYDATTGSSALGQGQVYASEQAAGGSQLDISTQAGAEAAVNTLAAAVATLGSAQAVVGKGQNQFNYAVSLAQTQLNNLAAAESRIRDADLASEAANLTKAQILQQAGIAALAQANVAPEVVLSLLRG